MLLSQRSTLHGVLQIARRLKALAAAAREHMAEHGIGATARKILAWSWRRATRRFYPAPAIPPPGGFEIAAAFDPGALQAGPVWRRDRTVVQEIPVHFDEVHSIEVLLSTYAR